MKEKKIIVLNKYREKLIGLETIPDIKQNQFPAIILVHGFGLNKEEYGMFTDLSKYFSKNNFIVYRFDFSGCGESEGDYSKTSLTKLKFDLLKELLYNWLLTLR